MGKRQLQSKMMQKIITTIIELISSLFNKNTQALPVEPKRETPDIEELPILRLGVIVGHTASSPGAYSLHGVSEYAYNKMILHEMISYSTSARFGMNDIMVIPIYRDLVGIAGAYKKAEEHKCDAVIELHFNAYNGRAVGTETLCTSNLNDLEFANLVHKAVCNVFERAGLSRGVKAIPRSGRGGENVHSFPGGVNCLVEPFFGDNEIDVKLSEIKRKEYAKSLVDATKVWGLKKGLIT